MPGRSFTSTNYRYGMNGQEKDDEIAGAGNIMTAEYWEYDSRLGRRWNIDPVIKSWQSEYCTFSNNPVSRIDILGDDDHFDANGKFLNSDAKATHFIYVQNGGTEIKLSQVNMFQGMNLKAVASVVAYYSNFIPRIEEGQVFTANRYVSNPLEMAYFDPSTGMIAVAAKDGKTSEGLDDKYNLMSTIDHEGKHKQDFKARAIDNYSLHYRVYLAQLFDADMFGKTQKTFQTGMIASTVNHLLNAYFQDNTYEKAGFDFDLGNLNDIIKKYNFLVSVSADKKSFQLTYIKDNHEVKSEPIPYKQLNNTGE